MTTTRTSHTDCDHPATKAARAKCRKARTEAAPVISEPTAQATRYDYRAAIEAYYQGEAEVEEIMADLRRIAADTNDAHLKAQVDSYYEGTAEVEEIMAAALRGVGVTPKECTDECHCEEGARTERVIHTTYDEGDVNRPIYHDRLICKAAAINFWTTKFNGYDHWSAKINGGSQKILIATARRKLKALGVDMPR
jgi:hypothetical protein